MSYARQIDELGIEAYLAKYGRRELLRLLTCGSVDDGKSTLIGRMLYDSQQVFDDVLAATKKASERFGTTGTELDVWQYILREKIEIVPLYFAAERPTVERDGLILMVDDERMRLEPGEQPVMRKVRFRTLGCYPLSGAVESDADTVEGIVAEMLVSKTSERQGRAIDRDAGSASMEKKKQEGYF